MNNRGKIGIGCLALLLVLIGVGVIKYYSWKHETERNLQKAGEYVVAVLHKKYDRDFLIEKGHYIPNTGGYEFSVYPKENKDFTFNAWLNGMTESGESDEYLLIKQKNEAKKILEPFISCISNDYYISNIDAGPIFKKNRYKQLGDINKNQLTVNQMIERYPGKMSLSLSCHINYNITSKNENSVLKKVYKLIEFLKAKKFGYIQISLYFYDFPDKSINKLGHEDVNFSLDYRFKAPIWIHITQNDIQKMKNYKDLKNYFIYSVCSKTR